MNLDEDLEAAEREAVHFLLHLSEYDLAAATARFDRVAQFVQQECDLGEALANYTDPTHPEYDPEFDQQIRAMRPDWFDDVN